MQVWDCELREHSSAGATSSAYSWGPTRSLAVIACRQVEDWASGRPKGEEVGMVNNTSHRCREPAIRPVQHEKTWASTFLYFPARRTQHRQHWRRTKSDATNSKPPSSRCSTAANARRAGLGIQNLLRIVFRIDFGRAVFLAECAQKGREDVEFCMQSSSTSQNDKPERISRSSQNLGRVLGTWRLCIDQVQPIAALSATV